MKDSKRTWAWVGIAVVAVAFAVVAIYGNTGAIHKAYAGCAPNPNAPDTIGLFRVSLDSPPSTASFSAVIYSGCDNEDLLGSQYSVTIVGQPGVPEIDGTIPDCQQFTTQCPGATSDTTVTGTLDVSSLPPGVYTVQIQDINNDSETVTATRTLTISGPGTPTAGSITISGISPNPATNQITVTGDAAGGINTGGLVCQTDGANSPWVVTEQAITLTATGTYSIDGVPSGEFSLVQTQQGIGKECPPPANPAQYLYSFTFSNNTNIASLSNGSHLLQVCAEAVSGGQLCSSASFTVNNIAPPPPNTGTLTVTSENADDAQTLVPASWDLSGDATSSDPLGNVMSGFVCSASYDSAWLGTVPCSGTQETYSGVLVTSPISGVDENYTIPPTVTTNIPYYTFNSIQQIPIAEKKSGGAFGSLGLALDNMFSTVAQAYNITPSNSQTLTPSLPTASFIILWTPNPDMQVSSANPISLTSASPSQTVTITNDGAPASELGWTAAASTNNGANWLTVSPGSNTVTGGGSPGTFTVSYDPSVATGTYSDNGTITIYGYNGPYDQQSNYKGISTKTIPVTLNLTASPVPGYDCVNYACTQVASNAQYSTQQQCNASCTPPPPASTITDVSVSCAPSSVYTVGSSACTATVNGTGNYSPTVQWIRTPVRSIRAGTISPGNARHGDSHGDVPTGSQQVGPDDDRGDRGHCFRGDHGLRSFLDQHG